MRRKNFLVPLLAIAVLLVGGLWTINDPNGRSDKGLRVGIATDALQARPAGAVSIPTLFTVEVPLRHNNRQAIYIGEVACDEEGRQLRVRMTLTQDHGAEGWGQTIDRCTGDVQRFDVRVNARGPKAFQLGEVHYSGWAGEFERGRLMSEATWEGTETLVPQG